MAAPGWIVGEIVWPLELDVVETELTVDEANVVGRLPVPVPPVAV